MSPAEQEHEQKILDTQILTRGKFKVVDNFVIRATEVAVAFIGSTLMLMVSLQVISRYVFEFSIFAINAAAQFLLVWFFLLGAGLALRQGAHVGLDLLVNALPSRLGRIITAVSHCLVLLFLAQMLWGGFLALEPAMRQTEISLGITRFWVMLAFPVGFGLLIYHQLVLFYAVIRGQFGGKDT